MARRGPTPPGGDEPNPTGYGDTGSRGGSSQSWGTAGLTFDTKGIKDFTAELKKAAAQVEKFWAPFKDTKTAEAKTSAFFGDLKKHLEGVAGHPALGGGAGGGKGTTSGLGGDTTMPGTPE